MEQKLVHLLNPLEKNEQSMVKLDSIFKALGVETEKDVRLLAQYFLNHRQYKELIKIKFYIIIFLNNFLVINFFKHFL